MFPGHLPHLQEYLIFPFEPFFCEERTWLDRSFKKKIVYNIKILLVNNAILVKSIILIQENIVELPTYNCCHFLIQQVRLRRSENSVVNTRLHTTTLAVHLSSLKHKWTL